jgi:hypothetical protein
LISVINSPRVCQCGKTIRARPEAPEIGVLEQRHAAVVIVQLGSEAGGDAAAGLAVVQHLLDVVRHATPPVAGGQQAQGALLAEVATPLVRGPDQVQACRRCWHIARGAVSQPAQDGSTLGDVQAGTPLSTALRGGLNTSQVHSLAQPLQAEFALPLHQRHSRDRRRWAHRLLLKTEGWQAKNL